MPRRRSTSVQALVEAAAKAFEKKGYADATISDIAAEAGVSKPTVYQYVKSKQWLLENIVDQLMYPLRDGMVEIVGSDASSREKLNRYLRLQITSAVRYRTYYSVLMTDQHQLSPHAVRKYISWAREMDHIAAQLFEQCAKDGVTRADLDIPTVVQLVNSMISSIGRWYRPTGRLKPEGIFEQVVGLLSGFILPSSGGANASEPFAHAGAHSKGWLGPQFSDSLG